MRRRHEHRARLGRRPDAVPDIDALAIDRYRMGFHAGVEQRPPRQRIAGIFDPEPGRPPEATPDDQIDRMLGAGRHHDLLRITSNRARSPQIIADRATQFRQAARIGIAEVTGPERAKRAGAELAPDLHGPGVHQGAPQVERALLVLHRDVDDVGNRPRRHGSRCGGNPGRRPAAFRPRALRSVQEDRTRRKCRSRACRRRILPPEAAHRPATTAERDTASCRRQLPR